MYGVRLTSLGPYRLFAYLGVPHGDGPFPAVYYVAKYGSVVETIPQGTSAFERSRYVTLSIAARGQRKPPTSPSRRCSQDSLPRAWTTLAPTCSGASSRTA